MKMKIKELDWIYKNKEKLHEDDIKFLNCFDFFRQYESGELSQNGMKMLELLGLATDIYCRYNGTTSS
ncbi:hypothetical protein GTY48_15700 [Bacillus thuringiensis]|uniref:hypothetical protein n=1 Tax=Bacillus thuringiensis TaxID=1428 RepID=UPI00136BADC8|nr:hypothetical protein [Bacillus thuringiensis]MYW25012.1 hypothetical protein [Bacillus thuringiensis]MYW25091.1 hypothetical protein [Bacillus thuringiensis]